MINNILDVKSEEELRKLGSLKTIRVEFESIVGKEIKLKTNTWNNMYNSIIIIARLMRKSSNCANNQYNDLYFKGEAEKYIFFLLELQDESRLKKLKVNKMHYANKNIADKWKKDIAKIIHPDLCHHPKAEQAMSELNKLYEEMIRQ